MMQGVPAEAGPVSQEDGVRAAGQIRLYVAGLSPNSLRAQQNLRDATSAMKDAAVRLNVEVIDVFKGPKRAIADGILVTPTLVAQYAGKRIMMVGDLGDASAVRSILDACARAADGAGQTSG